MLILHIISGLGEGGAEATLYRLCTNDTTNQHAVISLSGSGKYSELLKQAGVEVICLRMQQGVFVLKYFIALWRLIYRIHPDVVQTWMYHADFVGGVLARLAGISKVVWGIRHSSLGATKSKRSTILLGNLNALLSWVVPNRIVCCAESAAQSHVSIGFNRDKFVIIPNGFDLSFFRPDPSLRFQLRAELSINQSSLVLGMVGRFDPLKDHFCLFKALRILKLKGIDFTCLLAGHGLCADNRQLIDWLDLCDITKNVILLDSRSDVPAIMNSLDFHVLSSSSEGFPNILAEAMACGTPCISTDVGDANLIVHETGWIVPVSNPTALANAIIKAIDEPRIQQAQRRCLASDRIRTLFSVEQMVTNYSIVYKSMVGIG